MGKKADRVKVIVRCRPLNSKEEAQGCERCVDMDESRGEIVARNPKGDRDAPKSYVFDRVFDWNSRQIDLYDESARPIVDAVCEGFNGTIFAYGQTGTGKTFTMEGVRDQPDLRGVIPNAFDHIFQTITESEGKQYLVRASYLEIYMEEIRDLLSKDQGKKLQLKEKPDTGVYVKNLSSLVVKSVKEIQHVMNVGNKNRSVGVTNMNAHSSRSHAIFVIMVECSEMGEDGENHIRVGKLNLVDLAGSERQSKTQAEGQRLKEASKINQSLSCLGNVISALVDGKSTHIPYRDSQLTRLLQDSLGGNAKTVMIANIGPADYNYDETINTLRYANRAKNIKNDPHINEDPKDALLREFQEEISRLKSQLEGKGGGGKKKKKKKKKTRYDESGMPIEDDDEDDDDDDDDGEMDAETEEQLIAEERAKLEQEKQAMLQDQSIIQEEKERLLAEMDAREKEMRERQEYNEQLAQKIKHMESKLLCGDKSIEDHTAEQERALKKKRAKIKEHERLKAEKRRELEKQEAERQELQQRHGSLQDEAEALSQELQEKYERLLASREEIEDLQDDIAADREELMQTMADLQKDLKLRQAIIEHFVPPEEVGKMQGRATFDEKRDQWILSPLGKGNTGELVALKRPVSAYPDRHRPISQFACLRAARDHNPRYRPDNILQLELSLPERTTIDYEGPTVAPRVQAALDDALQEEDDITMGITTDDFLKQGLKKAKRAEKRAATASSSGRSPRTGRVKEERRQVDPNVHTPQSRGLVQGSKRFA